MECAKGFLSDVVDTFADEAFVTLLVAIDTKAKADDELELAATLKLITDRVGYLPEISVYGPSGKNPGTMFPFSFLVRVFKVTYLLTSFFGWIPDDIIPVNPIFGCMISVTI